VKTPKDAAEALLLFFAVPDVGELVAAADDAELRRQYATFLRRLSTLKDGAR
jgi:hypothetical protein